MNTNIQNLVLVSLLATMSSAVALAGGGGVGDPSSMFGGLENSAYVDPNQSREVRVKDVRCDEGEHEGTPMRRGTAAKLSGTFPRTVAGHGSYEQRGRGRDA